jgi:hypothetical protein
MSQAMVAGMPKNNLVFCLAEVFVSLQSVLGKTDGRTWFFDGEIVVMDMDS